MYSNCYSSFLGPFFVILSMVLPHHLRAEPVDTCLKGKLKTAENLIAIYKNDACSLPAAVELSRQLHDSISNQNFQAYSNILNELNKSLVQAREQIKDRSECVENFCSPERELVDLGIHLQETWNYFYMDYITNMKWRQDARNAAIFAGGLGAAAVVLFLTIPKVAKEGNRVYQKIGQTILKRLRILRFQRGLGSRALLHGSSSARVGLQSAGIGVSAAQGQTELKSKTKITREQVFPSPYELIDFGKVENDDLDFSSEEHIFSELGSTAFIVAAGGVLPALILGEAFEVALVRVQQSVWLSRFLKWGRFTLITAVGGYATNELFKYRSKQKLQEKIDALEIDINKFKNEIRQIKMQNTYSHYRRVSRLVDAVTELSSLHSVLFIEDIEKLREKIVRNSYCWPFDFPGDSELQPEALVGRLDLEIQSLRAKYEIQAQASQSVLREALGFVESVSGNYYFDLQGRLKETLYLMNSYAKGPELAELWRAQSYGLVKSSGETVNFLTNIWGLHSHGQSLTASKKSEFVELLESLNIISNAKAKSSTFECMGLYSFPAIEMRHQILRN